MKPKLSDSQHVELAKRLHTAFETGVSCAPLKADFPEMNVADAYAIQALNIAKSAKSGARVLGRKVGITSEAVQSWLNVDQPDFGVLTDRMEVGDGATCSVGKMHNPKAEGELAFVLGRDLIGPGIGAVDVLEATKYILPSIEIIDSRVEDWKITYEDTIADNASSAYFVLGTTPIEVASLDLRLVGMSLRQNGRVASTGAGAGSMNNPVNAVVWLANTLAALGEGLRAGEVVLAGALGPVVGVKAGDHVEVCVGADWRTSVRFVE